MTDNGSTATLEAPAEAPALSMTIFTKNDCSKCVATERHFERKGVPFREINVEDDLEPRDEFGGLTPYDYVIQKYERQMPVVVIRDDTGFATNSWTGANMFELHQTIKLFEAEGLLIPEGERQAA